MIFRLLRSLFKPELVYQSRVQKVFIEDSGSIFFGEAISTPDSSYRFFMDIWDTPTLALQEQVYVLFLNSANAVKEWRCLHSGGTKNCTIDYKLLLHYAVINAAEKIIVAHNHPSGKVAPSKSDIHTTMKIKEVCKILDITLLDHLIVTSKEYYSFSDMGYL